MLESALKRPAVRLHTKSQKIDPFSPIPKIIGTASTYSSCLSVTLACSQWTIIVSKRRMSFMVSPKLIFTVMFCLHYPLPLKTL